MNIADAVLSKIRHKRDGKLTCPRCGISLIPLPLYDRDTVQSEEKRLDTEFIHFSCWCGYIFARQWYDEFIWRSRANCADALNYPGKDWHGAILPTMKKTNDDLLRSINNNLLRLPRS